MLVVTSMVDMEELKKNVEKAKEAVKVSSAKMKQTMKNKFQTLQRELKSGGFPGKLAGHLARGWVHREGDVRCCDEVLHNPVAWDPTSVIMADGTHDLVMPLRNIHEKFEKFFTEKRVGLTSTMISKPGGGYMQRVTANPDLLKAMVWSDGGPVSECEVNGELDDSDPVTLTSPWVILIGKKRMRGLTALPFPGFQKSHEPWSGLFGIPRLCKNLVYR